MKYRLFYDTGEGSKVYEERGIRIYGTPESFYFTLEHVIDTLRREIKDFEGVGHNEYGGKYTNYVVLKGGYWLFQHEYKIALDVLDPIVVSGETVQGRIECLKTRTGKRMWITSENE